MQDPLPEEVWGLEGYSDARGCSPQGAQPGVSAQQLALVQGRAQDLAQVLGPAQGMEMVMGLTLAEWAQPASLRAIWTLLNLPHC